VVVFTPRLPPTALLHYRDFELVCQLLGGVCEYLDRYFGGLTGEGAYETAYRNPHVLHTAFRGAVFAGPWRGWWEDFASDRLTPAAERWLTPPAGCVLEERCEASPAVFLMSLHRGWRYVARCYSLTKRAEARGVELWDYLNKRRMLKLYEKPVEVVERLFSDLPPPETLASCTYRGRRLHGLASLVYWARNKAVASVDSFLGRTILKVGFTYVKKRGDLSK
jgi:hypothetical protein